MAEDDAAKAAQVKAKAVEKAEARQRGKAAAKALLSKAKLYDKVPIQSARSKLLNAQQRLKKRLPPKRSRSAWPKPSARPRARWLRSSAKLRLRPANSRP